MNKILLTFAFNFLLMTGILAQNKDTIFKITLHKDTIYKVTLNKDTLYNIIVKMDILKDTIKIFKYGGFSSLTFSQVAQANWVAGGENALTATGIVMMYGKYKKDKIAWDNTLDIGYGINNIGGTGTRKNEDQMELNSKFGLQAFDKLFYTLLINFRSQFSPGYNYPNTSSVVSRFMAPGYLTISLGLDYKPTNFFSFYLSPATGRFIFILDQQLADAGAYGVDSAIHSNGIKVKNGQIIRPEFGASLSTGIRKDILKNVNLVTKVDLFNDYTNNIMSKRGNIVVNWDALINIKSGKFLTSSIMTSLIYDQDVIAKIQFKEGLGIGLSYKF